MYALPNKTQHKLIAKVRGGISQKLDNLSAATSSAAAFAAASASLPTTSFIDQTSKSNHKNLKRDFSPIKSSSPLGGGGLAGSSTSKEQASNGGYHYDDSLFNSELKNCLPQPVFHHTNYATSTNASNKKFTNQQRAQKQCITPEHNEMIKYVQQSWKEVELDYKKSVNSYINNIDINSSSQTKNLATSDHHHSNNHQLNKHKQGSPSAKKKIAPTSTPLLLTGSYHHTSVTKDSTGNNRQDSFRPFDLETFWGNRILKRLTQDL